MITELVELAHQPSGLPGAAGALEEVLAAQPAYSASWVNMCQRRRRGSSGAGRPGRVSCRGGPRWAGNGRARWVCLVRNAEIAAWPNAALSQGVSVTGVARSLSATGVVGAGADAGPRGEAGGGGEAGDAVADLGEDHFGGPGAHARNGHREFDAAAKGRERLVVRSSSRFFIVVQASTRSSIARASKCRRTTCRAEVCTG